MVKGTAGYSRAWRQRALIPKAIKTILISHLHGDHIYGLMNNETNAQVFPNAEIVVPAAELEWWTRPGVESIDLGPTRKGLAQRIQATVATWKNVRPFEREPELLPGVHVVQAPGHSPGMSHTWWPPAVDSS
jgi:glyoxylase-like metal-dependent hydrolase (beta-lactamase superfamily II)